MKWIDKQIKKIPLDTPMLVTNGKVIIFCKVHYHKTWIHDDNNKNFIMLPIGFDGFEYDWDFSFADITHWAQLPEEMTRGYSL